jgi:hypothetical protein
MRWELILIGGLLLPGCLQSAGAASLASGIVMPVYGSEQRAEAVLRVQSLSITHQKRGFFRVGLLPAGRLDGVSLTLLAGKDLTPEAVRRADRKLAALASREVWEIHGFQFAREGAAPVIRASLVAPAGADRFRLKGVTINLAGRAIALPTAFIDLKSPFPSLNFNDYAIPLAELLPPAQPDHRPPNQP